MSLDPAWVALSLSKHIGSKTLRALMQYFGTDPGAILAADLVALQKVPGVGPKIAQTIKAIDLQQVEQAIRRWQRAGIAILTPSNPAYPPSLRSLDDRPATLFVRGHWERSWWQAAVAVVGTRAPSQRALEITHNLAFGLSERGCILVSGLAIGIDHAAHLGALAHPRGHTIAVLGSGVLNIYPPKNLALAKAILQRGALLCEVSPEAEVNTPSLVARNRIITGLCQRVIVVETGVDGGAMHAARFARQQGRKLYVVDNHASGNRALIADGAIPLSPDLRELEL